MGQEQQAFSIGSRTPQGVIQMKKKPHSPQRQVCLGWEDQTYRPRSQRAQVPSSLAYNLRIQTQPYVSDSKKHGLVTRVGPQNRNRDWNGKK